MEAISYKLPDFEGPLDLLLFLVQKNKLNILDIPIHEAASYTHLQGPRPRLRLRRGGDIRREAHLWGAGHDGGYR